MIGQLPRQDSTVVKYWIDNLLETRKKKSYQKQWVYIQFVERMVKEKYRIEKPHIEYIGEKLGFKPLWAEFKYKELLSKYK